jgi:hypothetical protein
MEINKLYDDVYEIKNFLSKEELDAVNFIIQNTPEEAWFDEEAKKRNEIPDFWYGKHLRFNVDNIFTDINNKMKNLFDSYSYYPEKLGLNRYKTGDFMTHHADQWIPDLPYYIGYGFCLYYNDNYDGGELDYPDLNMTIKPKANTLYIHGGHIVHGSFPVLGDRIRYFSTVFIQGTEEFPTILNKELFK